MPAPGLTLPETQRRTSCRRVAHAVLLATLLAACAGTPAKTGDSAALTPPAPAQPTVNLWGTSSPITSILRDLQSQSRQEIDWPQDLDGQLTVLLQDVAWDVALQAVVATAKLHAYRDGDRVVVAREPLDAEPFEATSVVPPPVPMRTFTGPRAVTSASRLDAEEAGSLDADLPPADSDEDLPPVDSGGDRLPIPGRPPSTGPEPDSETIDLDAENVSMQDVMARISAAVGVPIHVDPEIGLLVSERFRGINWRLAVDLIAKTYNCVVSEDEHGALHVGQQGFLRFGLRKVPLSVAVELIATYLGHGLVFDPAAQETVSLDWALCSMTHAYELLFPGLEVLSRATKSSIEYRNGVLVVAPKPVGWGDPAFDFDPLGVLSEKRYEWSATSLRGRGVGVRDWFRLLSRSEWLVVVGGLERPLSAEFTSTRFSEARQETAQANGLVCLELGSFVAVRSPAGAPRNADPPLGSTFEVSLADGRNLSYTLHAVLVTPQHGDPEYAEVLINGEPYSLGSKLLTPDLEAEIPAKIVAISASELRLVIEGDTENPLVVPFD